MIAMEETMPTCAVPDTEGLATEVAVIAKIAGFGTSVGAV
jgi:hypothetical protein